MGFGVWGMGYGYGVGGRGRGRGIGLVDARRTSAAAALGWKVVLSSVHGRSTTYGLVRTPGRPRSVWPQVCTKPSAAWLWVGLGLGLGLGSGLGLGLGLGLG